MTKIEVFSDGSATTADKPGGWAWVMVIDGKVYSEGSGHAGNVSNNDMELEASIQGLTAALKYAYPPIDVLGNLEAMEIVPPEVTLVSDSQLVLGWASGNFRFKQESKLEKYRQLQFLMKRLNAQTRWVKGHGNDIHNNRCDKLANNARKGITTEVLDKNPSIVDTRIGNKKTGIFCVHYAGKLRVIDLENGIVEVYNREAHGKRGSAIEIREDKDR
jgi:ribonuclease HI